ncbi:hypothetical protein AbraIFM66950_001016 [Aspergillus brasiliensis]|nr:hypothetical protein AbraIFM66950_001016 [Aspergillus brasiliensis]
MRFSARSVVWSALLACTVPALGEAAATASNSTQSLRACVSQALVAGDVNARIVDPSNDTYTDARLGEKIQFNEFPALIAYAKEADEVASLVRCAQRSGFKAVPRSGGHHFEAWSALNGTLVIDLSHINHVNVSADTTTATVGAGIRQGALYLALDEHNVTFPGGICPTVALGGLVSSGGFSLQMRALGLAAEYVQSARVVLADGSLVTASSSSHEDLFWAIRGGGGGTYGIIVDFDLQLMQFPTSAMVAISWNASSDRYPVAQRFFDWAPVQIPAFTSQVNVYKSSINFLGQYLGGTENELRKLINESGLLDIGTPTIYISGNCDTDNSRLFGYTSYECVPANETNRQIMNVLPEPFSQYDDYPQYQYENEPEDPSITVAEPWARFNRISKSFFMQKDNILPAADLKTVIDMMGELDTDSEIWGEWHAWNISSPSKSDYAFAWREQAYAHLEFQVHGSLTNSTKQATYEKWFTDLETFLRPKIGVASYSGEMDAHISTNPFESYYGDNVCRLVEVKKSYDPNNFFTNPDAITPTVPEGITC